MSLLLVIMGFGIARFGAHLFQAGEAAGEQSLGRGVVVLVIQLSGWALIIWGVMRFFS